MSHNTSTQPDFASYGDRLRQQWEALVGSYPDLFKEVRGRFVFQIEGAGRIYMDCLSTPPLLEFDSVRTAECEVRVALEDLIAIVKGELNPQLAFLQGRVKLSGDLGGALRLNVLFKQLKAHIQL
jgi:predicted lipid carrier protein YhbT